MASVAKKTEVETETETEAKTGTDFESSLAFQGEANKLAEAETTPDSKSLLASQREAYDQLMPDYVRRREELEKVRQELITEYITPRIPKHATFVDLGCGTGDTLKLLQKNGYYNLTGIDQSPEMLKAASEYEGIFFRNQSIPDFIESKESFDVVMLQAVLHLFPRTEAWALLEKLLHQTRVRLYLTTPLAEKSEEGFFEKNETGIVRFKHHYTMEEMEICCRELFSNPTLMRFQWFLQEKIDNYGKPWIILIAHDYDALQYLTDGYVISSRTVSFSMMKKLRKLINLRERAPIETEKYLRYGSAPEEKQIVRIERFAEIDPELGHFMNENIPSCLEAFLGADVKLFKEKLNFKRPGDPSFPPHQDAMAGWPAGEYLTVGIPLTPMTLENGALHFATGEHHAPLSAVATPLETGTSETLKWKAMPMIPGEMVLFHGMTPHYSPPNKSKNPDDIRPLLLLTYVNASSKADREEFFDAKVERQPPVDQWDPSLEYTADAFGKYYPVTEEKAGIKAEPEIEA